MAAGQCTHLEVISTGDDPDEVEFGQSGVTSGRERQKDHITAQISVCNIKG